MSPIEWNVDPEIVTLFGVFPLRYYGLLFVTGLLLGYGLVKRIYKSEGVPTENLEKLSTFLFIGVLVGARLGHCLFYDFAYFSQHPLEIFLPFKITDDNWHFTGFTGLASHGGTIGAILAILLYCYKSKTSLLWVMDRVAIGAPITAAFIRFGNFMNSEIYGKPTESNYGVIFMRDDMIPRHPTQLYEAFSYLIIFGILWYCYKKTDLIQHKGFILGLLMATLFSARLLLEVFKENQVAFEDEMMLNMGQLLSIPFIGIGIALIVMSRMKNKPPIF
ncbi:MULTISPECIES: prolipoprotein diacylglyceryl transferase [Aquimarina]|uniref:Phosphatidylglycerol--prolipoprotein diacylglyceryl transferase n=1 Tax=Aquimarina algiphila TaxID=2047982 RepID=A0A554VNR9_9FLAO|nr:MULTISPECIES: prolipoprotein diacylglyceryl transferase [Aquimarina]TSE10042.1 prolipoprotein diacylglyceryl transferase [Aquimarina algiphila]